MKQPSFFAVAMLALAGFASGAAFAQDTPRVDARQARQQARIAQGAASGSLTGREERRLERQQSTIAAREAAAKADGTVTPQERRALNRAQNRANHDIARQKRDRQRNGG
jgi:uncharacterized membrane protein YebE (DUF533 family)